jgi:thiamine biosynthesis lipoprotein
MTGGEKAMLTRRRFIEISAAAAVALRACPAPAAVGLTRWTGTAIGASTSITLTHPNEAEARRIIEAARAEIARLERIFSLYHRDSIICRLNREGHVDLPPFDFLSLLSIADGIHQATAGAFDPTIQPLWQLYARHFAEPDASSRGPDPRAVAAARAMTGWKHVTFDNAAIRFIRPGMAVTLNGIAQGYATDCVAELLRAEGLRNVLVNVGEIRALGCHPEGRPWKAGLAELGDGPAEEQLDIADTALATTAPRGTFLDGAGRIPHLIDPVSGKPRGLWRRVSVLGPSAAIADGLSTGFAIMPVEAIRESLKRYPGYRMIAAGETTGRVDLAG